ncbi:hypothetical protein [Sphingobacterium corticibacterium]|uniref:Serpin domain-containing protein n=1 Tax=Sphingobacterium corticibacterium TaxID=2484746 RepID=A0A4Q6XSD5_9SPHI|nr:hypothetical protein [Sphingobacterium corticibacterium]RZF59649.1 hypothetical protein EWE74_10840 [Sphingobacterium corticibacterium]
MYTKTSLILFWLLLTVLATRCQLTSGNQIVYAATPDTSDLYFTPTMQEVLPANQNALYAASFPFAWQTIRKELRLSDDVKTESKDLRMLDGSETVKDALNEDGISMKTEAEIIINDGASPPEETPVPKRLVFDKPFYIVMKKTDKKNPYMILYVADASLLEKTNNKT